MTERDRETDELLPFLANATLEGDERARAVAALATRPELRDELAFAERLRRGVKDAAADPDPGELPLRRALREIERERARPRAASPGWRTAAIAAGLALVVQGAVIAWLALPDGRGPRLLGGEAVAAGDRAVLQVTFVPTATEAGLRAALAEVGATVVEGPSAAGVYRIALRGVAATDLEGVTRALAALRARTGVVAHVARDS